MRSYPVADLAAMLLDPVGPTTVRTNGRHEGWPLGRFISCGFPSSANWPRLRRHRPLHLRTKKWLRPDRELAPSGPQTLAHADQSKTVVTRCVLWIESNSIVGHKETNHSRLARQLYLHMTGLAVLDYVAQRFLHCAEQAERGGFLEVPRQIPHHTLDFNFVLLGNLMAEITYGGSQSEVVQLGWMQLMRHVLDVSRDFIDQLPKGPQFPRLHRIVFRGCSLLTFLDSVCQQRQPLVDVVVQLARNTHTLLLSRLDEPATEFDESSLRVLLIADVHAAAHVSREGTAVQETRRSLIEHPAIRAVGPPHAVLADEFLFLPKSMSVSLQVSMQVIRMYVLGPPFSQLLLHNATREC